ncbi:hypothetical protein LZZ85_18930 [Terrimonas sp. NA20]|uniref:Uncharacterized protein n=1 Tax=Terrimonas ginsenosidimutans TaxID=2908004 RepID=A0ABS9KVT5_9BACT|nr:hypothetical protein [Terrimonas ginsenosidimutans]MCG2616382.1 hypothetical protein [Terrimonas ginsenosidimutans]
MGLKDRIPSGSDLNNSFLFPFIVHYPPLKNGRTTEDEWTMKGESQMRSASGQP